MRVCETAENMKTLVLISCVVLLSVSFCESFGVDYYSPQDCPWNQYYDSCGTLCPKTCDNYNDPPGACAAVCNPSCQCYNGFVKNKDGECVLPRQCPNNDHGCSRNQHFVQCGAACPLTCDNYKNPPQGCIDECISGCICNYGYVMTEDGQCIVPDQCPNKTPACSWNQYYNPCGTPCPKTCDNYNDPPGACAAVCNPTCQCYDGYIKNENGECVLPSQCPRKVPACPRNQYYDECGTPCEKTCDNYNDPPGACATVCNPSCQCYDGYIKNKDGDCVSPGQCPNNDIGYCPMNEEYSDCVIPCNTCNIRGRCHFAVCNKGCDCRNGYFRDADEVCIPAYYCPAVITLNR